MSCRAIAHPICYVLDEFVAGTIPFLGVMGFVAFVLGPALIEANWIAYLAIWAIVIVTGYASDTIARAACVPSSQRGRFRAFLFFMPFSVMLGAIVAFAAICMPLISAIVLAMFRLCGYPY